jgi:hypothetical protein
MLPCIYICCFVNMRITLQLHLLFCKYACYPALTFRFVNPLVYILNPRCFPAHMFNCTSSCYFVNLQSDPSLHLMFCKPACQPAFISVVLYTCNFTCLYLFVNLHVYLLDGCPRQHGCYPRFH